jgi:hypothetical protein
VASRAGGGDFPELGGEQGRGGRRWRAGRAGRPAAELGARSWAPSPELGARAGRAGGGGGDCRLGGRDISEKNRERKQGERWPAAVIS